MKVYKVKSTLKQMRAADNIISGRFSTVATAMRDAGYSKTTSHRKSEKLLRSKGFVAYMNRPTQMEQIVEGLFATKLVGRKAIEWPDWQVRLKYVRLASRLFGWIK